jgi:ABC-type antimicrobial peptide transport system permease subunit
VVPGIADENSILWSMGKKIGDTIDYTDELGRNFKVRLVGVLENSVLQGNIIIGEKAFLRHFPGESGYRFFLMDASVGDVREAYLGLSHALQDVGLELSTTANRLDEYNAVQNTYLNTFQALGGLGLLLGSIGLGIVVLRNVQERRSEIAILQAVGYRRSAIQKLVLMEHSALLLAGLMIGTFAAIVAVLPAIAAGASRFPFLSLGLTLLAVLLNGFLCTWLATKFSLRGNLAASLRDE